jgi:hypothetical protein
MPCFTINFILQKFRYLSFSFQILLEFPFLPTSAVDSGSFLGNHWTYTNFHLDQEDPQKQQWIYCAHLSQQANLPKFYLLSNLS